jgi:peroxiredoxin
MKKYFLIFSTFLILLASSCDHENKAIIEGSFEGGPGSMIYLEKLENNKTVPVDSFKIRKNGRFTFKIEMNTPAIYLLKNQDSKFLTFLPFPGDDIKIFGNYDNPGRDYTVEGSEESEKIRILNEKLYNTRQQLRNLNLSIENIQTLNDSQALEYLNRRKEILKEQRDFSIHFIIENLKSIASVYAIYQTLEKDELVLGENRDIQYMKILADSISLVYPEVPFVDAFIKDARAIENKYYNLVGLSNLMEKASVGLPDISLPDPNGTQVALSSLKGKVVLLYFWASLSQQSIETNLSLINIYKKHKSKGFEVYAVSLDNNKENWLRAIRIDELNWINVSDLKYPESNIPVLYNVNSIPANFLINREGTIIAKDIYGAELERWLGNLL